MKITITQTDLNNSGPFAAAVQFDDGPRHPVTISDPFDAKAEGELQWYFEQWLGFPFTDQVPGRPRRRHRSHLWRKPVRPAFPRRHPL